jgi:hypothetical protein
MDSIKIIDTYIDRINMQALNEQLNGEMQSEVQDKIKMLSEAKKTIEMNAWQKSLNERLKFRFEYLQKELNLLDNELDREIIRNKTEA